MKARRMKIKKVFSAEKKGFTLMEVLVTLFIFTILVTAISEVYVQFISAQQYTKSLQKRQENLQMASNMVSKTARTSKIIKPISGPGIFPNDTDKLRLLDYSRYGNGNCLEFRFIDGTLKVAFSLAYMDELECDSWNPDDVDAATSFLSLTDESYYVSGEIYYQHPVPGTSAGLVALSLQACDSATACSGEETNALRVQSTVSLRQ